MNQQMREGSRHMGTSAFCLFISYFFRLFRLDTSKFRSGILNSYGPIPIAPQAVLAARKPERSALRANLRDESVVINGFPNEIFDQKDNRTRGIG